MMNSNEFEEWAKRLDLTEEAKKEIQRVRQSPPARRVGGGKKMLVEDIVVRRWG